MLSRLFSKYFLLCSQNLVTRKGSSTVSSQVPEPQILISEKRRKKSEAKNKEWRKSKPHWFFEKPGRLINLPKDYYSKKERSNVSEMKVTISEVKMGLSLQMLLTLK